MKKNLVYSAFFALITTPFFSFSQAVNDYQTSQPGNWDDVSIWQRFDGSTWQPATASPISTSGVITVNHAVNIASGFTVVADQLIVTEALSIATGGQLTLTDGVGTDLDATSASSRINVWGTFLRSNGSTIDNQQVASRVVFEAGSAYRHNYTTSFGDLPIATWDVNSTVFIQGFANTVAITANTTWSQSLGNVVYNSPGQRQIVDFAGHLTTILGDFTIVSTGTYAVHLSSAESPVITIGSASSDTGGDLNVQSPGRLVFSTTGTANITIYGNWNHTSTNGTGSYLTYSGTTTVELYGDFVMNAGTGRLHMANTGTTGRGTVNFHGDFSFISGRIDETGSNPTQGVLRFVGNGQQKFINTGVISGLISYFVGPTSALDLSIYPLVGSGSMRLEGTLLVGSLDTLGAVQGGTLRGNIRTPSNLRTYAGGSTIVYNGQSRQYIGSGHPTGSLITTVIDNPSDVKLATNLTVNGTLRLQAGRLNLNNFTLTSTGSLETVGGLLAGSASSNLVIGGTTGGVWGTLAFDSSSDTLNTLSINRTGTNAEALLNSSLKITYQLILLRGTLNNVTGLTMINGATIRRYNTGILMGASPFIHSGNYHVIYQTSSVSGGPYADFTTGSELPTDNSSLGDLVVGTAQASDAVRLSHDVVVNGTMGLGRGTFHAGSYNVTMQGSTWADNTGNFDAGTGTVIFNGVTSVGGSSDPTFGNIQLNASRAIELTRSVTITGNVNFASGSMFTMDNFTVTLSGPALQTVSAAGATFHNINLIKANGADVQLISPLNVTGMIQFSSTSSNVDLKSDGYLTLISTSDASGSGTASIYRLLNGNTVSGDVTVQRYMSGEGKIYRYISSPSSSAMISQWKDDFAINGAFLDPTPKQTICGVVTNPASANLFYYNETAAGDINSGYVAYPAAGTSTTNSPIQVGRGYSVYIRQCTAPTVIDVTGPINRGTISLPVTYTVNDPSGDGWNLVGNPYPSTIDWDVSGWTKTRVSSIVGVMDNASGFMRYYDAGVTNDLPNGLIAPGQAFWVRATGASPVLSMNENTKVTTTGEFFREAAPVVESFVLILKNGLDQDMAYVKKHAEARVTLDDYDAPKINNPTFNFSTLSEDNVPMAINAMNDLACGMEMKLGISGVSPGDYSIAMDTRGYFASYRFTLVDKYVGKEVELSANRAYAFTIANEASSQAFDRFFLKIEERMPAALLTVSAPSHLCSADGAVALSTSEKDVQYSLWTTSGRQISAVVRGAGEAITVPLALDSLTVGTNEIVVKSQRSCAVGVATIPFTVIKDKVFITTTEGAITCNPGAVNLLATASDPAAAIQWFEQEADLKPIFVGTNFETSVLTKSKTYYVSAISADGGCSSEKVAVTAEVRRFTPAAISEDNGMLTSNYRSGNAWYYEGKLLETETGNATILGLPGTYELFVTTNGCSSSATYTHDEEVSLSGLNAYPNPVSDKLTVEILDEEVQKIEFTSISGQVIFVVEPLVTANIHTVDFSAFSEGIYVMVVSKKTGKKSYRLFKK